MITEEAIEQLREEFCTASWALWSDKFPRRDSIEAPQNDRNFATYVKENSQRLRPEIVLLGLNPSGPYPSNFINFHSTHPRHNDIWLRSYVEEAGLEGAYMTDIIEVEESDSGAVDIEQASFDRFVRQLRLLAQDNFTVIAFGRDTFRVLASFDDNEISKRDDGSWVTSIHLDNTEITLFGVYHYTQINPDNAVALRDQLGQIGSTLH